MEYAKRRDIQRHINSVIGENIATGTYYRLVTLVALLPEDSNARNGALYALSDGEIPDGLKLITVATGHAPMELEACKALVEHPSAMVESIEYLATSHNMAMAQMAANQAHQANQTAAAPANYLDPFAKFREPFKAVILLALGAFAWATFLA